MSDLSLKQTYPNLNTVYDTFIKDAEDNLLCEFKTIEEPGKPPRKYLNIMECEFLKNVLMDEETARK